MQALFAAAALTAATLAASGPAPLPGVADEETTIPSGGIQTFIRASDSLLFVQHRNGRWYRIQLADKCLHPVLKSETLVFDHAGPTDRIDKFTTVDHPGTGISCQIKSIRQSEAPPQIDSKSPVKTD